MSKFTNATMGFRHRFKEMFYGLKHLSFHNDMEDVDESERRAVISMIDGKMWHGGLTDRFKGIVSGMLFAEYMNRPFRIHYTFPFQLTDYLLPNEYDWRISEKNLSKSFLHVRPVCTRHEKGDRMLKVIANGQIRFYSNVDITSVLKFPPFNQEWGDVFNRLFRPSPLLQTELDRHTRSIGDEYIAMAFRFQNLLGDFEEYEYGEIDDHTYRERLIEANLYEIRKTIESERSRNRNPRILVTSDSACFLEKASVLPEVYSIMGKSAHIDTKGTGNTNHIKAFVDFFMITKAREVISVTIDDMYPSDFPNYAAKVGNIPFRRIILKL